MRRVPVSNVVLLGLTSLFVDLSTEMVYPLVPLYLATTLGAAPFVIGLVEGIAESVSSFLKVVSGHLGDVGQRRKALATVGYAGSVVYKLLLIAAGSWPTVLLARVVDRTGKGLRTAPRDSLIAQSSAPGRLGGSFGVAKMLDMAGSTVGAALAVVLMASGGSFHEAFWWSIPPAVLGVLVLQAVREVPRAADDGPPPPLRGMHLDGRLRAYLAVVLLFCLGNSSNAFLLLKAAQLGYSVTGTLLLYVVFNLAASVLAVPAGRLSDRIGRRGVLVPGYALSGLVYVGLAVTGHGWGVPALFVLYGACTALLSGAERAFVAEAAPPGRRGTVLGLYGMLQGVGLLLASVIAGGLWSAAGSDAPFWFGGVLALLAAVGAAVVLRTHRPPAVVEA
jgi:MFS family permease